MQFRTLNLDITKDNKLVLKNNNLEIKEELLFDAYDFIIVNFRGEYCDLIIKMLENQNYVYHRKILHLYVFINNKIRSKLYYYTTRAYRDIKYYYYFNNNRQTRYKVFEHNLPCFIHTNEYSEINFLSEFYKITEINISEVLPNLNIYYIEQKGGFTKKAQLNNKN